MSGITHMRVTLIRCGLTIRRASNSTTMMSGMNCTHSMCVGAVEYPGVI
jgi:hypothetical protein